MGHNDRSWQRHSASADRRIKHFPQAITANHRILGDHRGSTPAPAVEDEEILGNTHRFAETRADRVNTCQWRSILLQTPDETLNLVWRTGNLDFNTARIVSHPTSQPEFLGQAPDQRAKPDALHDATDPDALTNAARIVRNLHVISPEE